MGLLKPASNTIETAMARGSTQPSYPGEWRGLRSEESSGAGELPRFSASGSGGSWRQLAGEELLNGRRDFGGVRCEGEMAGVEEADFGVGVIAPESFSAGREEERVVLAPDREQGRLLRAEVFLEFRVEGNVAGVIEEEIELDLVVAGTGEERGVEGVGLGSDQRFGGEEVAECGAVLRGRFLPIFLDRIPALAEAFFVGVAVLRNDGGDAVGMGEGETESDGCAVVEDIDGVTAEAEGFGEAVDDLGKVIEGVAELLAVRSVGETEAGKVGSEDVVALGERRDQVAKHVGRGREPVEQQDDGRGA